MANIHDVQPPFHDILLEMKTRNIYNGKYCNDINDVRLFI